MPDAPTAMDRLRAALDKAGVVTRPAAMTDADIDHIARLAHEAHAEIETAGIRPGGTEKGC